MPVRTAAMAGWRLLAADSSRVTQGKRETDRYTQTRTYTEIDTHVKGRGRGGGRGRIRH